MPSTDVVYHVEGGLQKHEPLDLKPIFNTKISGKCLKNDEGVPEEQ